MKVQGLADLPTGARHYTWMVLGVAGVAFLVCLRSLPASVEEWLGLALLAAAAAITQMFPLVTSKDRVYRLTPFFIFVGLLTLPPGGVALLVVLAYTPEWIRARYSWYSRTFVISSSFLSATVAGTAFRLLAASLPPAGRDALMLAPALVAACLFIATTHLFSVVARDLAGERWPLGGLFDLETLLIDSTLTSLAIFAVLVWRENPWLLSLAIAPLLMGYRDVNKLRHQARTDAKTALYNTTHFQEELQRQLRRAVRTGRPLSVIMADLDLLREVNNTYGHLAGDVVIRGVADIIQSNLRSADVAARFGGEEFAILLPDTDASQALVVAERLRRQVEDARHFVPTCFQFLKVTLSLGIATYPTHGQEVDEVVNQADRAVYYSKLLGRNRSWVSSPESAALGPVGSAGHRLNPRPGEAIENGAPDQTPPGADAEPAGEYGGEPGPGSPAAARPEADEAAEREASSQRQADVGQAPQASRGKVAGLGRVTPHAIWTPRPARQSRSA